MPLQNIFEIDLDIKQKTAIKTTTVTQNDAVVFIFRIFDEGRIYDIQSGTTFTMTSTRPDNQTVMTVGKVTGENIVQFELGTTELEVVGKVESVIQIYDADGRVSTIPFSYKVLNDPSTDYIPSEDEQTLIQQVLGEGPQILADAEQATEEANTLASEISEAEELRVVAENERAASENARQTNEATRASNENIRQDNEAVRENNETARQNAESERVSAENIRESNESTRQSNESARQTDTAQAISNVETATTNANEATSEAQNLVDTSVHLGEYNPEAYYVANNQVRRNGSTWRCLQDSQGIEPVEGEYWTLVAQRGMDGTGSVASVNGRSPDENGNVELIASDVGAATPQDVKNVDDKIVPLSEEVDTVDQRVTDHLNEYMPHDDELNEYASDQDENGVYRVVDFKRLDGTLHLKSTLSNPDAQGKYQTCTLQFYEADGVTVALTKTWTFTLGEDGSFSAKEVA
jgi:hypothetical protein